MTESLSPRGVPAHISEIRRAIWTKGFGGAKSFVERVQSERPVDPEVLAYSCVLRLWSGDMDGADKVAQLDQCGRKVQAKRLFEAARRRYPSDHTLRIIEAGMAAEDGDLVSALRKLGTLPPEIRKGLTPKPASVAKAILKGLFTKKR